MLQMPFRMNCDSLPAVLPPMPSLVGNRAGGRGRLPSMTDLLAALRRWLPGLMSLLFMIVTCDALAATPPELHTEVQLSDVRPYAQQTVMLRLHIIHSPEVTGLDVDPVQAPDFRLKLVAGPPRTTRFSGTLQMTSDFVYALTPLSSGPLRLPPLVVRAEVESAATLTAGAPLPDTSGVLPGPMPLWSTIIGMVLAFVGGGWLVAARTRHISGYRKVGQPV
jgi:hypothetical protein